jgi:predicted HAD superfamily Cof-like phosphohydrolase
MGVELEPFFDEVHGSNMKKVGGRVRGDGKQLKPEGWRPPDLAGVYHRLYGNISEVGPHQEVLPLPAVGEM